MKKLFTSESVTEGHPDKICDAISDAILDAYLKEDSMSRVACEAAITTGVVFVMGEITSKANVDIVEVVRDTVRNIGYTKKEYGFDSETCRVIVSLDNQSPDIAMGVDRNMECEEQEKIGAGDQGMMFGYASNETPEYMPMAICLAHKLAYRLSEVRKTNVLNYLRPDGKTQVTIEYSNEGLPVRVDTIVCSAQHDDEISRDKIVKDIKKEVIEKVVPSNMIDENTKICINPTGRFVVGGPQGDSGLTGRKIIVDSYGGYGRHGGGAFSGKDCTKVDRSGAYMARYIAKNIVAAGLADKCEIQLAYTIGVAEPTSIYVETFGTNRISEKSIVSIIERCFDCRPCSIIEKFKLRRPIYGKISSYGHFGRIDLDLPWERLDKVKEIKDLAKSVQK